MPRSTILGRLLVEVGRGGGAARFFGGRIALEMNPGADAGRREVAAAALLAARGDSSSSSSLMLASLGMDSSVISVAGRSLIGGC